jgi:hypothetical protein
MRESALFGITFGLGAGAVLVGVTVSRLVVGHATEKVAEPAALAAAQVAVVSPVAEPPPETAMQRQHRALPRKHLRPPVAEETAVATPPVPTVEAKPAPPSPRAELREGPTKQQLRALARKQRPVVVEEAPVATAPVPTVEAKPAPPPRAELREGPTKQQLRALAREQRPVVAEEAPVATASVPDREADVVPRPSEHGDHPIRIVRGGAVPPILGSRSPGARIIRIDP